MVEVVTRVNKLESKPLDKPDELRKPLKAKVEISKLGEVQVGRFTFEPGWSWAESVKPIAKTEHCELTHIGYCIEGAIETWTPDGERVTIQAGEAYTIPPGHDARVVSKTPFVGIEFASAAKYAVKS